MVECGVKNSRNETIANALLFVTGNHPARQYSRIFGFYGDDHNFGVDFLQAVASSGDGATRANGGNKGARNNVPQLGDNLLGRFSVVNSGVGFIGELASQHIARILL